MAVAVRTSRIATTVTVVALAAAASLGATVSCSSHDIYDGSFDAGAAPGSASGAFQPGKPQTIKTPDGTLTLQIPANGFASPTTINVVQGADRDAAGLLVPSYLVTSDHPLVGPIGVIFSGNPNGSNGGGGNPGGNTTTRLVVTIDVAGAQPAPLPVGGDSGGGRFGIATSLGVFSLASRPARPIQPNKMAAARDCVQGCCSKASQGGVQNGAAVGTSCQCDSNTNSGGSILDLGCFLGCPDIAAAAELCGDFGASTATTITCGPPTTGGPMTGPGAMQCSSTGGGQGGPSCCITTGGGFCGQGANCDGLAVQCTGTNDCAAGYQCCAFTGEVRCSKTCPKAQRVCRLAGDCDGAPCALGTKCVFSTCGAVPTQCK